jgi:hypothetical protein
MARRAIIGQIAATVLAQAGREQPVRVQPDRTAPVPAPIEAGGLDAVGRDDEVRPGHGVEAGRFEVGGQAREASVSLAWRCSHERPIEMNAESQLHWWG